MADRRAEGIALPNDGPAEGGHEPLLDLPGVAVGQLDLATGRYVAANAALCELSGYTSAELVGREFLELTDPEERERDAAMLRRIRDGELREWQVEKRLLRKDGAPVWVQVTGRTLDGPDGRPARTLSALLDISARKAAEERLEAILASIDDHLASYDHSWRFTYVNDAAAAVLGKPKEELLGRCIWELFPDAIGNQYYRDVHAAAQERRVVRSEFYYAPFEKWFENHIYPTATGVTVFAADVTWRKRAEALQRDAERRKDEFLAALSHELRNPLAPILAAARVIRSLDPAAPGTAQRYQWAAGVVERQGELLARLVDDLLDVSRITRGKIELRRSTMPLAELVERSLETVRPAIETAGHEVRVLLPAEPLVIAGDPARLAQALANVLHNAAKFTPAGGHIVVQVTAADSMAEVRVRDDGPGIPVDRLERVFEMFEQGEAGAERGGLGIGLTIVRRLVELHGGSVVAHSLGAGTGTELVLKLPLAATPAATGGVDPQPPAAGDGLRVLVVDDNVDAAESLAELLSILGHQAAAVHDGEAALAKARELAPEVILLDIGMPGMDGYEVAARLRAQPALATTRLVAVTGWGQTEHRRRTRDLGFDQHLVKPIDVDELRRVLATLPPVR